MPNWTSKQKQVIEERGKNLLVSAAAGSGKTTVMVERILNIICSGESSIDRLLVVTFTNAAADSMRGKIARELEGRMAQEPENRNLRRQQALLGRASISTIDAFCSQLLKKYYFATPLPPQFTVLEEAKLEMLRAQALDETLEAACLETEEGKWPAFAAFARHFSRGRSDSALEENIRKVYAFAQASPVPEAFFARSLQYYDCPEPLQSVWAQNELLQISFSLKSALEQLEQLRQLAAESPKEAQYLSVLDALEAMAQQALEAGEPGEMLAALQTSVPRHKTNTAEPALHKAILSGCKQIRELFKDQTPVLEALASPELGEDMALLKEDLEVLFTLARRYGQRFGQLKLENGGVDYNDLEHYAIALLEQEEIRREVREQYDFIFVDEYQDSNGVQEYITASVSRGDNLFFVGDVKQSIYRFRLADPGLFIDKMRTYSGVLGKRIDLNNNFRSAKAILEGVNFIFENIMRESIAEIEYDGDAALYPAPEGWQHWARGPECRCEKQCVGKDKAEETACEVLLLAMDAEKPPAEERLKAELRAIGRRILQLEGTPLYDGEKGTCRPARFKDMVILARSAKKLAPYAQEIFGEMGIPLFCEPGGKLEQSLEVALVMDLLQVLALRRCDHALIAVLHSCIGGFSPDELAAVRTFTTEGSYYDALAQYKGDGVLEEKIAAFLQKLDRWSLLCEAMSLEDFLWRLYKESGYYYYVAALPGGERRLLNLELLAQSAEKYTAGEGSGLRGFLKYYQNILSLSAESSEAFSLGEADNVVRLMTVHKSKGLEFPVVFLASCGSGLQLTDRQSDKAQLLCHKSLGTAAMLNIPDEDGIFERRDPLPRQAILRQIRRDSLAEEMRLLYVALTRAVNRVILCGSQAKKDISHWFAPPTPYTFSRAKSYFDLLMPLLSRHKDGEALHSLTDAPPETLFNKSRWNISLLSSEGEMAGEGKLPSAREAAETTEYRELFVQRFVWRYPHAAATVQRSKQSVSSLKEQRTLTLNRPAFLARTGRLSAAERGSLLHLFLQRVDLKGAASPLELSAQLAQMEEKGYFSKEETRSLQLDKINRFFASDMGTRMRAAKEIYRELPFSLLLPDTQSGESTLVQGVIDCCFREKDGWVLLDYKTDYVFDNTDEIVERHRTQLELYARALRALTGTERVEMVLYLFSAGRAVRLKEEKEASV